MCREREKWSGLREWERRDSCQEVLCGHEFEVRPLSTGPWPSAVTFAHGHRQEVGRKSSQA
jgi:hypothetical protein